MAQRTVSSFKATKNTRFADNTAGEITEGDSRDMYEDVADSFLNISDHLIDEDDMASDSATKVPSQQSVKAYVDAASSVTNPDILFFEMDDFIGGIPLWAAGGTRVVSVFGCNTTEKAVGVYEIGGTSSGVANVIYKNNTLVLGTGNILTLEARLALSALSDGTDTYTVFWGLANTTSGTNAPGDGCYFRYTHSVNSGNYECVTATNGTETATDSTVTAAAGAFSKFKIVVNASGTSVTFYINDTLVATNSTNIPTATTDPVWPNFRQGRTAGTASVLFYIDWYSFKAETSGGR